ncbi:TetR/AcrR family transcriptional regulator [Sporolactobacillus sp. STCC-11]|uniref:TetR/AcrR family transcriptional regulator n=1 Tax=Sporolactobacillus caesalpiniae TaxID=3230362 RepID=UPI00339B0933
MNGSTQKKKLTSRDLQAIERKKQLLDSARNLFAEKGFHNTSTKEINRAIGMADGLMYYYFPEGKQQILDAVIQEATESKAEFISQILQNVNPDDSVRDMLVGLLRSMWALITTDSNRKVLLIMFHEQPLLKKEQTSWIIDTFHSVIEQIAELLEERVQHGELRPLNCRLMARQLSALFQSYLFERVFILGEYKLTEDSERYFLTNIDFLLECWK